MNDIDSPRRPVLTPVSNRILHHPSLQSLYSAADPYDHRPHEPTQPISPEEIFYIDPTMYFGGRIPNIVCDCEINNYFQLNTPPPIMSVCVVPSNYPDPLKSGLHPARDLGQSEWAVNPVYSAEQPNCSFNQFAEEGDQTTTYLLNQHHQELQGSCDESQRHFLDSITNDLQSEDLETTFIDEESADDVPSSQDEGRLWSEEELEAAETLLSRFILMEEEEALTLLEDLVPLQPNEELLISAEVQHGSQTGLRGCTFPSDIGDPGATGYRSEEVWGVSVVTERMLSDSECDAVSVLLSIRDAEHTLLEGFCDPQVFGANQP